MIRLLVRHPVTDAAGNPVRNKNGNPVFKEISDGIKIPENALLVVRAESRHLLESTQQSFNRLANAIGAKLDIGHVDDELSDEYDADKPESEAERLSVAAVKTENDKEPSGSQEPPK
jgi:hypothetical protein